MRVLECNVCGEPLTAANDDELARRLEHHMEQGHGESLDDSETQELVADQAYDAADD